MKRMSLFILGLCCVFTYSAVAQHQPPKAAKTEGKVMPPDLGELDLCSVCLTESVLRSPSRKGGEPVCQSCRGMRMPGAFSALDARDSSGSRRKSSRGSRD